MRHVRRRACEPMKERVTLGPSRAYGRNGTGIYFCWHSGSRGKFSTYHKVCGGGNEDRHVIGFFSPLRHPPKDSGLASHLRLNYKLHVSRMHKVLDATLSIGGVRGLNSLDTARSSWHFPVCSMDRSLSPSPLGSIPQYTHSFQITSSSTLNGIKELQLGIRSDHLSTNCFGDGSCCTVKTGGLHAEGGRQAQV